MTNVNPINALDQMFNESGKTAVEMIEELEKTLSVLREHNDEPQIDIWLQMLDGIKTHVKNGGTAYVGLRQHVDASEFDEDDTPLN